MTERKRKEGIIFLDKQFLRKPYLPNSIIVASHQEGLFTLLSNPQNLPFHSAQAEGIGC
jgi:hypothetical protein